MLVLQLGSLVVLRIIVQRLTRPLFERILLWRGKKTYGHRCPANTIAHSNTASAKLFRTSNFGREFGLTMTVSVRLSTILRKSSKLEVLVLLANSVAIPVARGYLEKQGIRDI